VCTKFHLNPDISFLRYRAETKKVSNFCSIFRNCDHDLCPTNFNIDRTHAWWWEKEAYWYWGL
jgi:hypothetical protein